MEEREERRVLVTDTYISRGWEASAVVVIDLETGFGKHSWTENLIMRTCGFCIYIAPAQTISFLEQRQEEFRPRHII